MKTKITTILLLIFTLSFLRAEFIKKEKLDEKKRKQKIENLKNLAATAFKEKQYKKATSFYKELMDILNDRNELNNTRLNLAICYLKLFKLKSALKQLKILKSSYLNEELLKKVNDLYESTENLSNNILFFLKIKNNNTKLSNTNEDSDIISLIKNEKIDLAILKLLSVKKKVYMTYFYLGFCYEKKAESSIKNKQNYINIAIDMYKKALNKKEGLEALFNLARLYNSISKPEKAVPLINKIKKLYPESDFISYL